MNDPVSRESLEPLGDQIAGFEVAFSSPHELVLVKPAGIASELTTDRQGVSLISRVRAAGFPQARLPHRLDRMTSGLLLVSLSKEAAAHHSAQIQEGNWKKFYVARIVAPRHEELLLGEQKAYLKRRRDKMSVVRAGGKPSFMEILNVAPVPHEPRQSHVAIRLMTGRYHQIRVMMSELGCPLIGDSSYDGPTGDPFLEHVALSFLPMDAAEPVRIFRRDDERREAVAGSVMDAVGAALLGEE